MTRVAVCLTAVAAASLAYASGRWLAPEVGLGRAPLRAAVATRQLSFAPPGNPSAPRPRAPAVRWPGEMAAAIRLPELIAPLDQLALEQGHPAILLRARLESTVHEWGNAARAACASDPQLAESEVAIAFDVESDGSAIKVGRASVAPHRGAPVPDSVVGCLATSLSAREGTMMREPSGAYAHYQGPVTVRLRLGDGRICSTPAR